LVTFDIYLERSVLIHAGTCTQLVTSGEARRAWYRVGDPGLG
jgi:hypothetical protein